MAKDWLYGVPPQKKKAETHPAGFRLFCFFFGYQLGPAGSWPDSPQPTPKGTPTEGVQPTPFSSTPPLGSPTGINKHSPTSLLTTLQSPTHPRSLLSNPERQKV